MRIYTPKTHHSLNPIQWNRKKMSQTHHIDTHFTYNHPLLSSFLHLLERQTASFSSILSSVGRLRLQTAPFALFMLIHADHISRQEAAWDSTPLPPPPSILLIAYLLKSHSLWHFVVWKTLQHVHDVKGQLSHVRYPCICGFCYIG